MEKQRREKEGFYEQSEASIMGMAMLTLPVLIFACATAPQAQVKTFTLAKEGDTVQLFHGGSKLAKDEFCRDAIVTVYRPLLSPLRQYY